MSKLIKVVLVMCISCPGIGQSLKGTTWVNYYHMFHSDTIEFVPPSFIDSIYEETHDDYHYGWTFLSDSTMDITKEHYFRGTKIELDSRKNDSNFFDPPQENIQVNLRSILNPASQIISLHTWDHVDAKFLVLKNQITLIRDNEERTYTILVLRTNYLRVVRIK